MDESAYTDDRIHECWSSCFALFLFFCSLPPDLAAIGGLTAVFTQLDHISPSVRAAAFSLLGTCLRNNPVFQQQISDLDDPLSPLASWLEAVSLASPSRGSAPRCSDFMRRGVEAMERDASVAVRNKALLAVSGNYICPYVSRFVLLYLCYFCLRSLIFCEVYVYLFFHARRVRSQLCPGLGSVCSLEWSRSIAWLLGKSSKWFVLVCCVFCRKFIALECSHMIHLMSICICKYVF